MKEQTNKGVFLMIYGSVTSSIYSKRVGVCLGVSTTLQEVQV